jgi:hypothetical protein
LLSCGRRGPFDREQDQGSPAAIFIWLAVGDLVAHSWGPIDLTPESGQATAPWIAPRAALLILIALMVLGNMLQFVGAARAMRDLRATEVAELRLLERLRTAGGLATEISPDPALMPQVTAAKYFEAVDRFGSPITGFWPDPKATVDQHAVAAAALRLLTPQITTVSGTVSGPDPSLLEARGAGVRRVSPGCVGLSGYAGEPLPVDLGQAVQRGSAVGLSRLPSSLAWVVNLDGLGSPPEGFCSFVLP